MEKRKLRRTLMLVNRLDQEKEGLFVCRPTSTTPVGLFMRGCGCLNDQMVLQTSTRFLSSLVKQINSKKKDELEFCARRYERTIAWFVVKSRK